MSTILNIKDAQGNWHPVPYANGVTYTPSVDTEGVISWTNDGGKENPTPRNIKGADAVINGENTLTISAGENIEIEQEGSEMSIKVKNSKVITSESTDDTVPTSKAVYDFQDTAIDAIESILPIGTSTGDIDDAKAYKMMGVVAEGKVVQETTEGKNKWNNAIVTTTTAITPNANGGFKIQKVGDARQSPLYPISIPANTDYTISRVLKDYSTNGVVYCEWKATDDTSIWSPNISGDSVIANFAKEIKEVRFYLQVSADDGAYVEIEKLQLEPGSTATSYEPYTGGIPSPNPDYPQEITQVSSATLNRIGKNKFINEPTVISNEGLTLTNDGKKINIKGTVSSSSHYPSFIFYADGSVSTYAWWPSTPQINISKGFFTQGGTQNVLSIKYNGTMTATPQEFAFTIGRENATNQPRIYDTNNSYVLPIASNLQKVNFVSICFVPNAVVDMTFEIQLEPGSTATAYEPYQGQTIPIDLEGNTINAVSSAVHDNLIIDKKGNCAIERNVPKVVLDGGDDEGWQTNASLNNDTTSFLQMSSELPNVSLVMATTRANLISDYFDTYNCYAVENTKEGTCYHRNGRLQIRILNSRLNDVSSSGARVQSFKTFLSAHPTEVYYQAATPTIIPLPKLSVLPTTLEGINHIWVDTNIGRTSIEVKYVADLQKRIQELSTALVAIGGEA